MKLAKVYAKVKRSVVHQDEAIKKMILTVNHNLKYGLYNKQNILLLGSVGVGKTLLCGKCAEAMGLPFYRINGAFADGSFKRFQMTEAIVKLSDNSAEKGSRAKGIVLIEDADGMFVNGADNGFLSMAKSPEFYTVSGELGVHDYYDISGVTFIAEGQYTEMPKRKFGSSNSIGFAGVKDESIGEKISNGNAEHISSQFTRTIEMNPLSPDFVRDFLTESNLSTLNEICDGLETSSSEIDEIVNGVINRGVGLHSAAAVTSEVMYPKLEKKYFSSKNDK